MMAMYSIELRTIKETPNYNLFDFEYELYDNNLKPVFEEKFFEYFYFDEIGYPTVQRFKHMLKSKLHMIMPYYKQLYETELRAKEIDFMLNKDLTETFIRDLTSNATATSTVESNGSNSGVNDGFQSNTPQSKLVQDIEHYMSSANRDKTSSNYNDNNSSNSSTNNTGREETTLVSKGNIGITSSAELLEKWRKVIINIDELIFEDMQDLFMMVY